MTRYLDGKVGGWMGRRADASPLFPCSKRGFSLRQRLPMFNIILTPGEGRKVTQEKCGKHLDLDPSMLDSYVSALPSMSVASGNSGKQSCGSGELGITAVLKVTAVPVWAKGPLLQFQSSRKAMAQRT